eukprot:15366591-Ditylum_brightwellii.AAC.1
MQKVKDKSEVLENTEVEKTKLEEKSNVADNAVKDETIETEEESEAVEKAVTEGAMDDIDDKVVAVGAMKIEETSEVEEKIDGKEIAECTGVRANTEWERQLEFDEVSVVKEKVEADEEDIVEKHY